MRMNTRAASHRAAVLLVLALAVPSGARAAGPGPSSATVARAAVDLSTIRIDNFGQTSPTYFRGAQPEGRDYADLAALGIKTVINLTSHDAQANEQGMVERAGMRYVQIPMTTRQAPTAAELEQFMSIVTDPARQPVYVHCVGGKHRTGIMTAVYRMTQDGWSADQAFAEMQKYKFGAAYLHPEFKSFVFAYPATLANAAALKSPAAKSGSR
jgi:protein tyrosine/serine phosphatase